MNTNYVRFGIIGDGSCLIHSILKCLAPDVSYLSSDKQKELCVSIRRDMANKMTKDVWFKSNNGSLSILLIYNDLSRYLESIKKLNIYDAIQLECKGINSARAIIKKIKIKFDEEKINKDVDTIVDSAYDKFIKTIDSLDWIGDELFDYIMNYFNINLFFISSTEKFPYNIKRCKVYKFNRYCVIILNINNSHYEPLGIFENFVDGRAVIKSLFSFNDPQLFDVYRYVCY